MLDMLALHNTSAARTGFQEPFGSLTLGAQTDQTMLATSIICVHMISYVRICWTIYIYIFFEKQQIKTKFASRFGFTECFFLCFFFRRLVYILNNFTKWFCFFFRKTWETLFFLNRNTTTWFTTYFWIGPQIGVGFTKWFVVVFFFWKCYITHCFKDDWALQNGL